MDPFEIILLFLAATGILVLAAPFHVEIDTRRARFSVAWLIFEVGTHRPKRGFWLPLAGVSFSKRPRMWRLVEHLMLQPFLALDLFKKLTVYLSRILRSLTVVSLEGEISFSDPLVNGVCYGIVQGITLPRTRIGVNFDQEKWLVGRFSLRLFRLFLPTLRLAAVLPYGALLRLARDVFREKGGERGDAGSGRTWTSKSAPLDKKTEGSHGRF